MAAEGAPPAGHDAGSLLNLDALWAEGDAQTWSLDDWSWNPYELETLPRGAGGHPHPQGPAGAGAASAAALSPGHAAASIDAAASSPLAKRHKPNNTMAGPAAAAGSGRCCSTSPAGAAAAAPPLPLDASAAGAHNSSSVLAAQFNAWAVQQQQQQQAAMLAGCAGGGPGAASGPAPLRHCQALANGLPFLGQAAGAGSSARAAAAPPSSCCDHDHSAAAHLSGAPPAAAVAAAAGPHHQHHQHQMMAAGLDLSGLGIPAAAGLQQQLQQLQGVDCASVADSGSGSEGTAAAAAAAVASMGPPHLMMLPGGGLCAMPPPALQGASASTPSTRPPAAAASAAQLPAPGFSISLNPPAGAGAAAAGGQDDSAAAAAAAAADAAAAAADAPVLLPGGGPDADGRMVCQVAGCGKDLAGLKDYHQRYRICDTHIKLPQVMKDGRLQRFCQQCGRFHDLGAFDGARKSCREQLQKHNARRRRRAATEANISMSDSLLGAMDDKSEVGKLLQSLMANPFQLQALRLVLGLQTHPALPTPLGAPAEHAPALAAVGGPPALPPPPGSYATARAIMEAAPGGAYAPSYDASDSRPLTLAAKLFNVTPRDLPPDLRGALTGWLGSAPAGLEGYIRPGCVFLTLHLTLSASEYEAAEADGMARLLRHLLSPGAHAFWGSSAYMLQLGRDVAMVQHGRVVSLQGLGTAQLAAHGLPHAISVAPLALVGGREAQVVLQGANVRRPGASVAAKCGGAYLPVVTQEAASAAAAQQDDDDDGNDDGATVGLPAGDADATAAGAGTPERVTCVLTPPAAAASGSNLAWLEVSHGSYVSEPVPLLVVDDPRLAEEVNSLVQLLQDGALGRRDVDALLLDLGSVLSHISTAKQHASAGTEDSEAGADGGAVAAAPRRPALPHALVADKARRLLAFACDRGWLGVAAAVLPLVQACGSCAADIVAAVHAATSAPDGLSLLHRAVRSGSPELVRGVLAWGAAQGYDWPVCGRGPGGLTPLHLAALLDDGGVVALLLLDACGSSGGWTGCLTDDGVSPFHLAFQMGHWGLDAVLAALQGLQVPRLSSVVEQQLNPSGWQLLRAATEEAAARAAQAAAGDTDGADGAAAANGADKPAAAAKAAAAPSPGKPLKERHTSVLDACLYCQSTLPPLLLSIKAKCAGCGEKQPCVDEGSGSPAHPEAAAAAAGCPPLPATPPAAHQQQGTRRQPAGAASVASCLGKRAARSPSPPPAAAVVPPPPAAPAAGCAHANGKVLSVTALCQACHANRVLEVA